MARMFRQARNIRDVFPCDLDAILAVDEIEVVHSRVADPGYTACLMRSPAGCPGGGIWLAPGQTRGRERFSVAHELGHFHIPTHATKGRDAPSRCGEEDLRARGQTSAVLEWEANDFAAELLMPRRLFSAEADRRDVSIAAASELAAPGAFDVSVTAAAWRMIQTTRDACALIVSREGVVEWMVRSESWPLFLDLYGAPVPPETVTAGVHAGTTPNAQPIEVLATAWGAADYTGEQLLLESTHRIASQQQVLSLLWLPR